MLERYKKQLREAELKRKAQLPEIHITTTTTSSKPDMVKVKVTITKTVKKNAVNEFLAEYNLRSVEV